MCPEHVKFITDALPIWPHYNSCLFKLVVFFTHDALHGREDARWLQGKMSFQGQAIDMLEIIFTDTPVYTTNCHYRNGVLCNGFFKLLIPKSIEK